jgi:putative oxidoreductase
MTKYLVPLGRVCFALIFIVSSFGHFLPGKMEGMVKYAAGQGVPLANIAVPFSGILALLGGLSVAVGFKARWGAALIVLFLVPVTLMMHNFWAADPEHYQMQMISFMKNLSMLGGALMMIHFGSGPLSVDDCLKSCCTPK